MNNTFDIHRFGNLLAFDGRKCIRNFGLTFAILCGLNLVLWLLTLIFGFSMPTLPRWIVIYIAVFLTIILIPAKAFGDINLPREGVRFAMLPVSNLEKYLSYLLFCLLTPVFILLASWGVDSLLTLLPIGGFEHYIKSFGLANVMRDFFIELSEMSGEDLTHVEGMDTLMNMFGPGYTINFIIGIIFYVGIFMFGNLLFKTHKTAKTLAVMIGISYVVSMITQIFMIGGGFYPWLSGESMGASVDMDTISSLTSNVVNISNIIHSIFTIGLFVGIFFKLKTQKY